jgi:uncharacterized metal-binding protein YceD (DUF177 family)
LGKFDHYKIPLKSLSPGEHVFDYLLDTEYFKKIDGQEVQNGKVQASVTVRNNEKSFELRFVLEGEVKVPCDRCLDDMDQVIAHTDTLIVKWGSDYSEEGDNVIVIPEVEGEINIAWFLYEFVVLSIPIKHVHAPGKCNRAVYGKLRKHLAKSVSDEDEDELEDDGMDEDVSMDDALEPDTIDPRWEELRKVIDTN